MIAALVLLAAQSASGDGAALQPADAAAIVAGGKACIGATIDPAGQDARLSGWTDATGAGKAGMKTDGRVVTRGNVMLIVKTGVQGGCVVQAKAAPGFDKAAFVTALGTAIGTPVVADAKEPVTNLPNGELLVTQVGSDAQGTFVQLVVANQANTYARKASKGN